MGLRQQAKADARRLDVSAAATAVGARGLALDLLNAVLIDRRPLDDGLDGHAAAAGMSSRDRAFARAIAATTLRRLGQIDSVIRRLLERPLPPRAAEARNLLRLSVCQLVFLGTPPHAAVHSAVALARSRRRLQPYAKLVNAVLRRAVVEAPALLKGQDAGRLNTPDWLWTSWETAYGNDTARAIAEAHLDEPPLDLTTKTESGGLPTEMSAVRLLTGSLRLRHKGPVSDLPGFASGDWWVQDAAAALPAKLFGDIRGKALIDLCAAPGGKTAQLAAAGARVTAVERSAARMALVQENLGRLNLGADLVVSDAETWRPARPVDAVLLDAPCSATGTIRRHPDVARLKTAGDVAKLVEIQAALLAAAVDMVRPGGTLVYCACSLQPEEGVERIEALLADDVRVERSPIDAAEVGGLGELVTPAGDLRTLPCVLPEHGGMDGFFAARMRRL